MDDDPEQMLAAISARARKKAMRRALIFAITIVPGVLIAVVGIAFLGLWLGVGAGVGVAVAIALVLEKVVPDADP